VQAEDWLAGRRWVGSCVAPEWQRQPTEQQATASSSNGAIGGGGGGCASCSIRKLLVGGGWLIPTTF